MGWVTEVRISGDNDYPIFPVRYLMYYLYCDACGSFKMERWVEKTGNILFHRERDRGVRCVDCATTYAVNSPAVADLDHNPRGYTMDDVPLPLNMNYQRTGPILGPADEG